MRYIPTADLVQKVVDCGNSTGRCVAGRQVRDIWIDPGIGRTCWCTVNRRVLCQDGVVIKANTDAKLLLLADKPLKEPIDQYGPFVMENLSLIHI